MKLKSIFSIAVLLLIPSISFADEKLDAVITKLESLQKDIQTLEKAVYSKNSPVQSIDQGQFSEALTRQITKLSEIEKQIQDLTAKYEENNQRVQQLNDRLSRVSNDFQLRFQQLENNKVASDKISVKEVLTDKPAPIQNLPKTDVVEEEDDEVVEEKPADKQALKPSDSKPKTGETSKVKKVAKVLPNGTPSERFKFAMDIFRKGDFEKAEFAMREFVEAHPKSGLAGSAQFWYAETFYLRQLYQDAASAYLEGYEKYPNSSKAPENLLKLGITLAELGEKDQGCQMITGVKKAYPKADASVLQKSTNERKRLGCA